MQTVVIVGDRWGETDHETVRDALVKEGFTVQVVKGRSAEPLCLKAPGVEDLLILERGKLEFSEYTPSHKEALHLEISAETMRYLVNQAQEYTDEFEGKERLEKYFPTQTVVQVVSDIAIKYHYACKSVGHWGQGALGNTGFYKLMEATSGANLAYVCTQGDLERLGLKSR